MDKNPYALETSAEYETILKQLDWLARTARNTQSKGLDLDTKIRFQACAKELERARTLLRKQVYNVQDVLYATYNALPK